MGLFSYFMTSRRKKLLRKIDTAIDQVKHGTYNWLYMRYLERHDSVFAGNLAAAVTNSLFSEKPLGRNAEEFLSSNRETVDKEMMMLKGDAQIGNLVADAVQTKSMLIYSSQSSGSYDHNFGKAHDVLKKLDFLKKQEDVANPRLFITKAEKYFSDSLKKVKYL